MQLFVLFVAVYNKKHELNYILYTLSADQVVSQNYVNKSLLELWFPSIDISDVGSASVSRNYINFREQREIL